MFKIIWAEAGKGHEQHVKGYGVAVMLAHEAKERGCTGITIWELKQVV